MRDKPSVWSRTRRLELAVPPASPTDLRTLSERVAVECETTPEEVLAEAEEFAARCRAVGATTPRQMAEVVAPEVGCDPGEVWTEAERIAAWGRA